MTVAPAWLGGVSDRARIRATSVEPAIVLGEFHCLPDDPSWHRPNDIGPVPHVVFPGTSVGIEPAGVADFTADANQVVLYDAERPYRRRLIDPRGDHCLYLAVHPVALRNIARDANPDAVAGPVDRPRFTRDRTAAPPEAVLVLRGMVRALGTGTADPLLVDESLLRLVTTTLLGAEPAPAPGRSAVTRRRLGRLIEDTKARLAVEMDRPVTLHDLAASLAVSPYHLHRVFRSTTGTTIHAYREQLRLREGLARIIDGAEDLAALAVDLGFSSHSHFTSRFRRTFGTTPSRTRGLDATELRKMLTAVA